MVAVAMRIVCRCGAWALPELAGAAGGCASDFGDANAISLWGFVEKREGREGVFIEGKAWARG
jgi:hypothetical protein